MVTSERFPDDYKVNAPEITAGVVYKDENVTVRAIQAPIRAVRVIGLRSVVSV